MYEIYNTKTNRVMWSIQKYDGAVKRALLYAHPGSSAVLHIRKYGEVLATVTAGTVILADR